MGTFRLARQRVVISGGSSGIGYAVAAASLAKGAAEVLLLARSKDKLAQAVASFDGKVRGIELDVTEEAAVKDAFLAIGPFDHLVTAAAATVRGTIADLDTSKARALFESKFWGQHHCVKYAAPFLDPAGSVTLFSGWISRKPMIGTGTLAAIDGAIESLARVLSLELAPIRVNAVSPGMIDTPLWGARLSPEEQRQFFQDIGSRLPVRRAGRAEDIADAVVMLMTNGFMTGAVIDVDGGQGSGLNA